MKTSLLGLALGALMLAPAAQAQDSARDRNAFSLSLFPPLQTVPAEKGVSGLRLNLLYGVHARSEGLDLGLVNQTRDEMVGLGLGLLNIANDKSFGFRLGLLNVMQGESAAWLLAGYNYSRTQRAGLQLGLVNQADTLGAKGGITKGFQIGVLNFARTLEREGRQVGLLNIGMQGAFFPVMPLYNWPRRQSW